MVVAFAVVYLLAVCTGAGQSAENALLVGRSDQARIFGLPQWVLPLRRGSLVLVDGVIAIVVIMLIRRCWRDGVAAVAIVVLTVGVSQAL